MSLKNNYKIGYHTLSEGSHNITFHIDSELFSSLDNEEIHNSDCTAEIVLKKGLSLLIMDICIKGHITTECDRCLEDVDIDVNFNGKLIVRLTHEVEDYEFLIDDKAEDTMLLNPGVEELDLKEYIHDSIMLSLPLQRIHTLDAKGEGGCNADMLNRFTIVDKEPNLFDLEDEDYEEEEGEDEEPSAMFKELQNMLNEIDLESDDFDDDLEEDLDTNDSK